MTLIQRQNRSERPLFLVSFFSRVRGMLGRKDLNRLFILLPCHSIHTFGMRVAIDVAFFDETGTILYAEKSVRRGRLLSCSHALGVLERQESDSLWFKEGEKLINY